MGVAYLSASYQLGREKSIVDIGLFQLAAEANYQREEEVEEEG